MFIKIRCILFLLSLFVQRCKIFVAKLTPVLLLCYSVLHKMANAIDDIEDLIELLDINDDANDDVEHPDEEPGYRHVIDELGRADIGVVLQMVNRFITESRLELGMYGAIKVGRKGALYNQVRRFLTQQAGLEDLPTLRRYLTEPVDILPPYVGAGPGGKGASAQRLNTCVANVRNRVQRVVGMLLVLQNNR